MYCWWGVRGVLLVGGEGWGCKVPLVVCNVLHLFLVS